MNPNQNDEKCQDDTASKGSYEKPKLTTFGSVARLTMSGGSEALKDATMTRRKTPSM
jgi:hypothetical protein